MKGYLRKPCKHFPQSPGVDWRFGSFRGHGNLPSDTCQESHPSNYVGASQAARLVIMMQQSRKECAKGRIPWPPDALTLSKDRTLGQVHPRASRHFLALLRCRQGIGRLAVEPGFVMSLSFGHVAHLRRAVLHAMRDGLPGVLDLMQSCTNYSCLSLFDAHERLAPMPGAFAFLARI